MTYTGDVTKDGPADVRTLPALTISKIEVGDFGNNAYLLRCTETGDGALIDAAAEPERLLELIGDQPISAVITTHQHPDHWGALGEVAAAFPDAALIAHPLDAAEIPVRTTQPVEGGDKVTVGTVTLDVIHLRGHTPGSIALYYPGHVFTGDSLFPGGVGNTMKDPERFDQLYTDVVERIFGRFDDETWVYPGHGKDTTLGRERPALPEWRARGW
ncbi:MBL fold metallo-hydrolase [Streptosporangiaceae bacterium NEAU-GS5]|nr:MBL fold metallo-hydrolase [Streptosporangiaceae bacterium NEAU-GS5]